MEIKGRGAQAVSAWGAFSHLLMMEDTGGLFLVEII
jgi:hypothetical protein